jgi:hypothetical protein
VELVRVRRGPDPDLIIRQADGRHIAIAASWTDYNCSPDPEAATLTICLLDIEGLRKAARLVDHLLQAHQDAACSHQESAYDA